MQAILEERVKVKKKQQKGMAMEDPSKVKLTCRGCGSDVCSGEHIEIIENMHHVNVTPAFKYVPAGKTIMWLMIHTHNLL